MSKRTFVTQSTLVLLVSLSLLGCFVESSNEFSQPVFNRTRIQFPKRPLDANSEKLVLDVKIPDVDVTCDNSADCQPAIGLVTATENRSEKPNYIYCGGFLVGPNQIMLSQHCLGKDLITLGSGADASKRLWIHFPAAQGYGPVTVEGLRIISTFATQNLSKKDEIEKGSIRPQYAVVQLQNIVHRPFLEVSRAGFQDKELYSVVQVTVNHGIRPQAVVHSTQCRAFQRSRIAPRAAHDLSLNVALGDCQIEKIHRGAPIIDAQGKVRGIIHQTYEPGEVKEIYSVRRPIHLNTGVNFACEKMPEEMVGSASSTVLPESCSEADLWHSRTPAELSTVCEESLREQIQKREHEKIEEIKASLDPAFEWKIVSLGKFELEGNPAENLVAIPHCVLDIPKFVNQFRNYTKRDYLKNDGYLLELPRFRLTYKHNKYLVYWPVITATHSTFERMKFSPVRLATEQITSIELANVTSELGACSP